MKKLNKKGFTLAELLIVVAIIAVLVAISIPVFSAQLEKSREAVDAANIRAEYAEILSEKVSGETVDFTKHTVSLKQTVNGWATTFEWPSNLTVTGEPGTGKTVTFSWDTSDSDKLVATIG